MDNSIEENWEKTSKEIPSTMSIKEFKERMRIVHQVEIDELIRQSHLVYQYIKSKVDKHNK